jgi:sec-independent protein translocase protein TatA
MVVLTLLFLSNPKTIIFIIFVLVLFFGAKRIPELFRGVGQGVREFKDASTEQPRPPFQAPGQPQQPPYGQPQPGQHQGQPNQAYGQPQGGYPQPNQPYGQPAPGQLPPTGPAAPYNTNNPAV